MLLSKVVLYYIYKWRDVVTIIIAIVMMLILEMSLNE